MKNYFKNSLVLFLAAIMLASCGTGDPPEVEKDSPTTPSTDVSENETEPVETSDPYTDDLPKDLNLNGETINIMVGDVHGGLTYPTYYAEDMTGEIVNDSVYDRNLAVSERLKADIQYRCNQFTWDTRANYSGEIMNAVLADDDSTDLIFGPGFYSTDLIVNDYYLDMNKVEHIDFTKAYWTKFYNDSATINGKTYSALGNFSINKLQLSYVMYFNKQMFDNAGMKYPYESVMNGTWTLDTLEALINNTYADSNGDGTVNSGDNIGLTLCDSSFAWAFMDPCDIKIFDKDSEGKMQFVMGNEHNATAMTRLNHMIHENQNVLYNTGMWDSFERSEAYITTGTLSATDGMRDYEFDYGIVPYPKYDESYKDYITRTSSAISVALIPSNCKKASSVGAVLEAINTETTKTVIPAYYETALKVKYSRDLESVQVLDIVNEGITMQFVDVFSQVFSGYSSVVRDLLVSGSDTWASESASRKEAGEATLEALMEYYNK